MSAAWFLRAVKTNITRLHREAGVPLDVANPRGLDHAAIDAANAAEDQALRRMLRVRVQPPEPSEADMPALLWQAQGEYERLDAPSVDRVVRIKFKDAEKGMAVRMIPDPGRAPGGGASRGEVMPRRGVVVRKEGDRVLVRWDELRGAEAADTRRPTGAADASKKVGRRKLKDTGERWERREWWDGEGRPYSPEPREYGPCGDADDLFTTLRVKGKKMYMRKMYSRRWKVVCPLTVGVRDVALPSGKQPGGGCGPAAVSPWSGAAPCPRAVLLRADGGCYAPWPSVGGAVDALEDPEDGMLWYRASAPHIRRPLSSR